jgi:hypothetical protein
MTLTQVDPETRPYEFYGGLQFLLEKFDPKDKALTTRRAIELQAFRVSLFYPRRYRLTASGKHRRPLVDMIALARKRAALEIYRRYTARSPPGFRGHSLKSIAENLSRHFDRLHVALEILKEYMVDNEDPFHLVSDLDSQEYHNELQRVFDISKYVAHIIDVYRSNGVDLQRTDDRPIGWKIVIDCLCDEGLFKKGGLLKKAGLSKKSEKMLDNYFKTLEPTSIFHYLFWLQGCVHVLVPTDPNKRGFAEFILARGGSVKFVDELRDVCSSYNIIANEFNDAYGFRFPIIRNAPKSETETSYNSISPPEYNKFYLTY